MRPFLQTLAGKESPCTTPKATEPSCHVARTFRARRALGHLRPRNGMRWRAFLQKRAVRIMTSMIVQNSLSARVGIAVNAKMHTCVVHAYIFAHNAPAFLALSLVLEADASVDRFDGYCRCLKQRGFGVCQYYFPFFCQNGHRLRGAAPLPFGHSPRLSPPRRLGRMPP